MNQLENRDDVARLLLQLIRPLKKHYSKGKARMLPGNTAAHYGKKPAAMEGFARVLWGLGPLFAGKDFAFTSEEIEEVLEWKQICQEGIRHGTDPKHDEYWGDIQDYDQKMVETAALVTAMMLDREDLWDCFLPVEKENIFQWLNQINRKCVHSNNWRFFRILVNLMFKQFGLSANEKCLKEDLDLVESCYEGEGWYHDGNPDQLDYYIPFAFHYYGLIYAHFTEKEDVHYSQVLKERAEQFYQDFIYWFSESGKEVPFGRSLTYRFAHCAFFGAAAFADLEKVDYGVMKHLVLGNLRNWMAQPILDAGGILSIGYGYPNLLMSERYNAPGSPYWALKAFLVLALPTDHPFWASTEKKPEYEAIKCLKHPRMIVSHQTSGHVLVYVAGQHSMEHGACSAKYEKFVYSNEFGFSVPRGDHLDTGAFDNILAVSETGENHYRTKEGTERFQVEESYLQMDYQPMKEVHIRSTIIPLGLWHVRIHEIETGRDITLADGGFALPAEDQGHIERGRENGKYCPQDVHREKNGVFAEFPWGTSGAVSLTNDEAELVTPFPNTNLFAGLTVIPTVIKKVTTGKNIMVTAFFGDPYGKENRVNYPVPECKIEEDAFYVQCGEEQIIIKRSGTT